MTNADLTGARIPITLDGHDLELRRLTDRDISELDEWLRAGILSFVRRSLEGVTDERQRREVIGIAMETAMRTTWMSGAGARMMGTPDGLARILWQVSDKSITYDALKHAMFSAKNVEVGNDALRQIRPKTPDVLKGGTTDPTRRRRPKKRRREKKESTRR